MEPAIEVKGLRKTFKEKRSLKNLFKRRLKRFEALKGLDFTVYKGEIMGVVGRNGSGKSTLLKIILGGMPADNDNSVVTHGKVMRMALGMGFNANLTARDNIYINGSILGLSFREIGQKYQEILNFAGVQDFADTQIKYYSSGMKARLAFAIAINADADIYLLDEFFGGVGDQEFRMKSEKAFKQLIGDGKTVVLVSHSLSIIQNNCDRVLVLDKGVQVALGETDKMVKLYRSNVRNKKNAKV